MAPSKPHRWERFPFVLLLLLLWTAWCVVPVALVPLRGERGDARQAERHDPPVIVAVARR